MACSIMHTSYQPTDDEWKCPSCGVGSEAFWIEDNASEDIDCPLLHNKDGIICKNCDKFWTGSQIARILKKNKTEKPCPHCHGTGKVFVETEALPAGQGQ